MKQLIKIEAINEATAKKGTVKKKQHLKELQELFCSDQRLEEISSEKEVEVDQLTEKFDLSMHLNETSSDAESYTGFDYCE